MRTVVIESPLAGATQADRDRNIAYARLCMRDCLARDEAPFASHLLYPPLLDDADKDQRQRGMLAGFAIGKLIGVTVVYGDLGITSGMKGGITRATNRGHEIEHRSLGAPAVVAALIVDELQRMHRSQA